MFARLIKPILIVAALCVFSLSSIAVEPTVEDKQTVKKTGQKTTQKHETSREKPKACDFRISTA